MLPLLWTICVLVSFPSRSKLYSPAVCPQRLAHLCGMVYKSPVPSGFCFALSWPTKIPVRRQESRKREDGDALAHSVPCGSRLANAVHWGTQVPPGSSPGFRECRLPLPHTKPLRKHPLIPWSWRQPSLSSKSIMILHLSFKNYLEGSLVVTNLHASAGDVSSIPGSGRSPGEGNGNPLQYSCLGNPTDRGAWWPTVHGVAKNWLRLSN